MSTPTPTPTPTNTSLPSEQEASSVLNPFGLTDHTDGSSSSKATSSAFVAILVCVVVVAIVLYFVARWVHRVYTFNAVDCPVLLASPIRGSDFTSMPSTVHQPMYPVIDRVVLNNKGIPLPFQGNELALISSNQSIPTLNNQVQFTLNFWMRIENMDVQSNSGTQRNRPTNDTSNYATLFAMNTGSTNRGGQFIVQYNSAHNELVVSVAIIPTTAKYASLNTEAMQVFRIPSMLKLQKWQMVTVVLDNRNVDVYHNSRMHRSFTLPNVPYMNNTGGSLWKRPRWNLFPGSVPFGGTVSCARYFNYAFNVHEAYRMYTRDKTDRANQAPEESYLFWWTWLRGSTFTSLYQTLRGDLHQMGATRLS
jgi:hypothetical protein